MIKARIRDLEPGEPVADAEAISFMLGGVPKGTVQRWAQLDGWPRRHSTTQRGRLTEYSIAAAKATFERQRGMPEAVGPGNSELDATRRGEAKLDD